MEQKKALKPKVFVVFLNSFWLRNSACTRFKELGEEQGFDITYWNNTVFNLEQELGYPEMKIASTFTGLKKPVLNHTRKRVELALSRKRRNNPFYATYIFPLPCNSP